MRVDGRRWGERVRAHRQRGGAAAAGYALEQLGHRLHAELGRALALGAMAIKHAEEGLVIAAVEGPADDAAILVDLGGGEATRPRHQPVARVRADARAVEGC